jgi:hypothetical protein
MVRWYPAVQWFDGNGFVDLLHSLSPYRNLDHNVREPLLDAVAEQADTARDPMRNARASSTRASQWSTAETSCPQDARQAV